MGTRKSFRGGNQSTAAANAHVSGRGGHHCQWPAPGSVSHTPTPPTGCHPRSCARDKDGYVSSITGFHHCCTWRYPLGLTKRAGTGSLAVIGVSERQCGCVGGAQSAFAGGYGAACFTAARSRAAFRIPWQPGAAGPRDRFSTVTAPIWSSGTPGAAATSSLCCGASTRSGAYPRRRVPIGREAAR